MNIIRLAIIALNHTGLADKPCYASMLVTSSNIGFLGPVVVFLITLIKMTS
jgi:hypothetical protein